MPFYYERCQRWDLQHGKKKKNRNVLSVIKLLKENLDFWKEEDAEEYNSAKNL